MMFGRRDDSFIRGQVPMTKAEVRYISVGKLGLQQDSVVYDIGSGTGSVALEIAGLSSDIKVYAIERKDEALDLIQKNIDASGVKNVQVIQGEAPEALERLPVPTHVFIGGSGGNLFSILQTLYDGISGSLLRVVITAVSLETLEEMKQVESRFGVKDFEMVQIQTTRTKKVGSHRMMQGENPIWICSFTFEK